MRGRRFVRTRKGFELRLAAEEAQVIESLAGQLRDLVEHQPNAASARRLFPTAYPDDPEADAEFQSLVRSDLLARRLASAETLVSALDRHPLNDDEAAAVLGALNDLRLVLGTVLDVSEDDPPPSEVDDDDPSAHALAVYWFLGFLQEQVIHTLSS